MPKIRSVKFHQWISEVKYMNCYVHPTLGYHLSYVTLDPIQGCPYNCSYCLWKPYELTGISPSEPACTPKELYEQLRKYLSQFEFDKFETAEYHPQIVFAVGNITDMCATPLNRRYLLEMLKFHREYFPTRPVLIQTKSLLTKDFIAEIDGFGIPIIFAISAVFFPSYKKYEPGTPSPFQRLKNFGLLQQSKNLIGIHYWRPVTSIDLIDSIKITEIIQHLKDYGSQASVIAGLMLSDQVAELLRTDHNNPLHNYYNVRHEQAVNQMLMPEQVKEVLEIARSENYPVFYRQTSCALSYILKQPDYFSTFRASYRDRCEASSCPISQRSICKVFQEANRHPSKETLAKIARWANLPLNKVIYNPEKEFIFVETSLPQEAQNFLSHATGFLVRTKSVVSNSQWRGTHILGDDLEQK